MSIDSVRAAESTPSLPGRFGQTLRIAVCVGLISSFALVFSEKSLAQSAATEDTDHETEWTPLTTLRHQTSETLRAEALAREGSRQDDAIAALCDLYVLLRRDERYSQSEMLQQDASKIRRRLLTIATRREAKLKREKTPRPSSLSADVDSAIQKALKAEPSKQGILGKLAFQGGAQAAGGFDNGWQLVELIQRVVEPDFWDAAGGPGTVHYFAMRRVLVVRATSDVHEQIRELLLKLPR